MRESAFTYGSVTSVTFGSGGWSSPSYSTGVRAAAERAFSGADDAYVSEVRKFFLVHAQLMVLI